MTLFDVEPSKGSAPGGASRRRAGVKNDERSRVDRHFEYEVLEVSSDGGSRGNPGPAAIGAVVVDPSTEPPARPR